MRRRWGYRGPLRAQKVQIQDFVLEFIKYLSPPGKTLTGNTNDAGYPHIGFIVDDIRVMYEDMKAKGVHFNSARVTITDPTKPFGGEPADLSTGPGRHDAGVAADGERAKEWRASLPRIRTLPPELGSVVE